MARWRSTVLLLLVRRATRLLPSSESPTAELPCSFSEGVSGDGRASGMLDEEAPVLIIEERQCRAGMFSAALRLDRSAELALLLVCWGHAWTFSRTDLGTVRTSKLKRLSLGSPIRLHTWSALWDRLALTLARSPSLENHQSSTCREDLHAHAVHYTFYHYKNYFNSSEEREPLAMNVVARWMEEEAHDPGGLPSL